MTGRVRIVSALCFNCGPKYKPLGVLLLQRTFDAEQFKLDAENGGFACQGCWSNDLLLSTEPVE